MTMRTVFALCLVGGGLACSSAKPKPGKTCELNSECSSPLKCGLGKCHQECANASDCSSPGSTCIRVKAPTSPGDGDSGTGGAGGTGTSDVGVGVCQLPEDKAECTLSSDCVDPHLFCAVDRRCRNQCNLDKDCFPGLVCADHACAVLADATPVGADGLRQLKNSVDAGTTPAGDAGVDADGAGGGEAGGDGASGNEGGDASGGSAPRLVMATAMPALVRQGLGDDTVTVTVKATGLMNAKAFSFEGPDATDGGVADAGSDGGSGAGSGLPRITARVVAAKSNDTTLVLPFSIPHGIPLGKKTLTFTSDGGPAHAINVLEASAITSGPDGTDGDADGGVPSDTGTNKKPFRTFKQAMAVAG